MLLAEITQPRHDALDVHPAAGRRRFVYHSIDAVDEGVALDLLACHEPQERGDRPGNPVAGAARAEPLCFLAAIPIASIPRVGPSGL